ncbi:MAG: AAA family ATPase [Coriobacteriales bacterium]|nr:AAA family ATPase [Coriobacteriales bacterium]
MKLIGRIAEQEELRHYYESNESEFMVIYGRRRVGKTFLVEEYFGTGITFKLTGLAKVDRRTQLRNFDDALARQSKKAQRAARDWFEAFNLLRDHLEGIPRTKGKKRMVFIDEMPWLDTPKSDFITALEHFWNSWAVSQKDILLIVCGSATSWVTKKLLKNRRGLHNRVTGRISLKPFTLRECEEFYRSVGIRYERKQILESYMIYGGIPYYLRLMRKGQSLAQNVDRLCFTDGGALRGEFEELYHSLFYNPGRHISIVEALCKKMSGMTRNEISEAIGMSPGGMLSEALGELEQCGFIRRFHDFTKKTKGHVYQIIDPFTIFSIKQMRRHTASEGVAHWAARTDHPSRRAWSGYAFELACLNHMAQIVKKLGISGVAMEFSAWRSQRSELGAQIDLVIDRRDMTVNLCEMKYAVREFTIDKSYADELVNKREIFREETQTRKDVHMTMITTFGIKQNVHSHLIQSEITIDDLFA